MRAELSKNQKMVAFVWGESCMIPSGQVQVRNYDYNEVPYGRDVETYNTQYARCLWRQLIKLGFRQLGPLTTGVPTGEQN